jgi:hypothetical protein
VDWAIRKGKVRGLGNEEGLRFKKVALLEFGGKNGILDGGIMTSDGIKC